MEIKEVSETFIHYQILIVLLSWIILPIYRTKSNNRYIYFLNCYYRDEYHTNFRLYRSRGILTTDDDIGAPLFKGPNHFKYKEVYNKYVHYHIWSFLTFIFIVIFDLLVVILPRIFPFSSFFKV